MPILPVCGKAFGLRPPDGSSEIFVLETAGSNIDAGLALLANLATLGDASTSEASLAALCITDFEYMMLSLRRAWRGPRMVLGLACSHCRESSEFALDIDALLRDTGPKTARSVQPHPERDGWFTLDGGSFRLPVVGDQVAVARSAHPTQALAELCLDDNARGKGLRARIERAMESMAPEISRTIRGLCPACECPLEAHFSVAQTVLAEIRQGAACLHDDIDLIARVYHWPQAEILSLPHNRRRAYVARIRRAFDRAA